MHITFKEITPDRQYDVLRDGDYLGTVFGTRIEGWTWWGFTTSSLEAPTRYSYVLRSEATDALLRFLGTLDAVRTTP